MSIESNKMQRIEAILNTAEILFRKYSFPGVQMGQLSSQLGISRKTLYNYFPGGKQGIWQSCIQRRIEEYSSRLFAVVADSEGDFNDRAEQLLDIGRDAMDVFYGPGGLIPTTEDERFLFPELRMRYIDALTRFFEEGIRRGIIRSGLPVRTLAASLVVLISEWRHIEGSQVNGECKTLPEFVEAVLYDGILVTAKNHGADRLREGKKR